MRCAGWDHFGAIWRQARLPAACLHVSYCATAAVSGETSGVMRRTVTRLLAAERSSVSTFRSLSPYPCVTRFSGGTAKTSVKAIATFSARRSDNARLAVSEPTASVCPSIRKVSVGLRSMIRLMASARSWSLPISSSRISAEPKAKLQNLPQELLDLKLPGQVLLHQIEISLQ